MVGLPLYGFLGARTAGVAPPNLVPDDEPLITLAIATGFRKSVGSHGSPSQIHAAGLRTLIGRRQSSILRCIPTFRVPTCIRCLCRRCPIRGKEGTCLRNSSFRTQAMSRMKLRWLGFCSFRRLRCKRISTFRTLAAYSPHALMLSGGTRSVLRTHVARLSVPRHPACCIGAFAHFRRARTVPCDYSSLRS
jgi:hypothetical protein